MVAGVIGVYALVRGVPLVGGLALAFCMACWDQSDRPRRSLGWAALFIGVPMVVLGAAVGELVHGRWASGLVLAVFGLGTVSLAVFGDWRSRVTAGVRL